MLVSCFVFFILFFSETSAQPAQTIPDFTFFRLDKSPFKNKDLEAGKKLFFIFFDTECDHCQRATQYLNGHYDDFKKAAIQMLTLDSPEKITAFLAKYGANLKDKKNITFLQDTQYQFIPKFHPKKYPSLFLFGPDKKLIHYDDDETKMVEFGKLIKTGK